MATAPKKVFIKTFGCQMNEYDSSRMADMLRISEGLEPTEVVEEADVTTVVRCCGRQGIADP